MKVTQSYLTLCDPMNYTVHGMLQARILEWVAFPFSRGSSHPRGQTQVSRIADEFFTAEPQGKPKNTGVGSPSLLQRIFLTKELNQGLLHCRQILYQLSYQGSLFGSIEGPQQGWTSHGTPDGTPAGPTGHPHSPKHLLACGQWRHRAAWGPLHSEKLGSRLEAQIL